MAMNLTGAVVTAGGLDHLESGREYFEDEGSIPEKVHGVWKSVARPQKLRQSGGEMSYQCGVPCQSSEPRIPF